MLGAKELGKKKESLLTEFRVTKWLDFSSRTRKCYYKERNHALRYVRAMRALG